METDLKILNTSILDSNADVIVMSANPSLLAGSGVSGVIHKAAGAELEEHVKPLGPIAEGQAIVSPAFDLNAKYIIHAVCPRYYGGERGEAKRLRKTYQSVLSICDELPDVSSIAFVAMGAGVYKWPSYKAAKIAISELVKSKVKETLICLPDISIYSDYKSQLLSYELAGEVEKISSTPIEILRKEEALREYITSGDRLVPRSAQWYELYLLGTKLVRAKDGNNFPKPMNWNAGVEKKRKRLQEQINCARKYEFLHEIDKFLRDPKLNWEQESIAKTRGRNIGREVLEKLNKYKDEAPKLHSLINYVVSDDRIFPVPRCWTKLMVLGNEKQKEQKIVERFPPPLILAVFHCTSDREKQIRLLDQIEYAYEHGFLDEIDELIRSFEPENWFYTEEEFMDELDLYEFQESKKEMIFDNSKTTLINCFSQIRELEKTADYYFNTEHKFSLFITRLFKLYSIGVDPLKVLIQKNEEQLKEFEFSRKDFEENPKCYCELEKENFIQAIKDTELLLAKLKIVHVMQQLDESIDPYAFGEQFWDLLVEKNICQEDFSSEG
jgi:O-acetyl-ADP-ribose deacetylase (regulator of RNase III)